MILDQLFEDDKKKKLNEVDPRNYDSDEDYYAAVRGNKRSSSDDDYDYEPEDDINDMDDDESYYEKYVRTKNLEGYETTPFGGVTNSTPNYSQAWKVTDEGEEFLRKAYQRLKRAYNEGGQVEMINIGPALSELQQQKFGPAYVQQSGPYQMMTTDISRLIEKIEPWQKQYNQQHIATDFDPEDFSTWNKQQGMSENTSRKTDAKGRTQQQWIEAVYKKFPDARIVQAKMIDGPAHAMLPDGRKFSWTPVQGMAEAKASTAAFRASNAKRAKLNAMSPEERKEYDKEQAEKQRKRDDARLEKERQKLAAKKGIDEDLNRRGFLQGLGMAAAGAAGLGAAGAAQARATPDWMEKVKRAKALMAKGQSREQTARIMGIKGPNPGGAGPMSGDWGAVNYAAQEMRVKESTNSKQRKLNEAMLMEDPVYRNFKNMGHYIAERRMSEKEILQVFADAESGMTNKGTGANRTFLGRGKDTAMDFAGGVKDAVSGVLNSIQNSVPVSAVDVAYDQATDALANVAGGQKGAVMQAIKKYRNLVKQYPKTAGFAKAALVAIAGLATGGAGLPAIAGLTYALDSAIKGDKLSSVLGKGTGAAALAAAGQAAFGGNTGPTDNATVPTDNATVPTDNVAANDVAPAASRFDDIVSNAVDYKVKQGDTLSDILADRKINPEAFKRLPGNEVLFGPDGNPNILKAGQTIKLPDPADVADLNKMSWTTPSDPNLAKDFGNPDFYTGQYNQNSTSGLDAANNLKQQELGRWGSDNGMSAARVAKAVRESVKIKKLSADKLIDQKSTVLAWALNESTGRKSNSINLTTVGTYAVFENVDRYRKAIMEKASVPGSTRPEFYRPDMSGGPGKKSKPGIIGKGLNWLDKAAGKVGGALSNFGHQFTTGVTKEKLKMNWHQAGKPSDSDALAAWLVKQGVPQEVVTSVYGKMGIPYTPQAELMPAEPDQAQAAEPAATNTAEPMPKAKAQQPWAVAAVNPATGKQWTPDELKAQYAQTSADIAKSAAGQDLKNVMLTSPQDLDPDAVAAAQQALGNKTPPQATTSVSSTVAPVKPTTTTVAGSTGWNDPKSANYVGRREVARRQAAGQGAAPAKPNFAQQGGYAQVNQPTAVKYAGMPAVKPAAPAGTKVTSGGPTPAERKALDQRIAAAAQAQPVAETVKQVKRMMETVTSKADVQRIKDYIDYHMGNNLTESAQVKRNRLISEVTQLAATRRREIARRMAQ